MPSLKKRYLLVYNQSCYTEFVKHVEKVVKADGIIWIEKIDVSLTEDIKYFHIDNSNFENKTIEIIVFDIYLLPVISAILKLKHEALSLKICFVQHGSFSDLSIAKRKKFNLSWFVRSLKTIIRLHKYRNHINHSFISVLFSTIISFIYGSFILREKFVTYIPKFDVGFFWNYNDEVLLGDRVLNRFENIINTQPPDSGRISFIYNKNSPVIYIDQPLVEDGYIDNESYLKGLKNELDSYDDLQIIVHPKSNDSKFIDFPKSKLIKLDTYATKIETSLIFGHFSSLLLIIPENIPIRKIGFGNPLILQAINISETRLHGKQKLSKFSTELRRYFK